MSQMPLLEGEGGKKEEGDGEEGEGGGSDWQD